MRRCQRQAAHFTNSTFLAKALSSLAGWARISIRICAQRPDQRDRHRAHDNLRSGCAMQRTYFMNSTLFAKASSLLAGCARISTKICMSTC